jgi:hypothetical protein
MNMVASTDIRRFCIPYGDFPSGTAFHLLDTDQYFTVPCPYRETQATIVKFLADGFSGAVPRVVIEKAPARDLDADHAPDDVDREPCNPKVQ